MVHRLSDSVSDFSVKARSDRGVVIEFLRNRSAVFVAAALVGAFSVPAPAEAGERTSVEGKLPGIIPTFPGHNGKWPKAAIDAKTRTGGASGELKGADEFMRTGQVTVSSEGDGKNLLGAIKALNRESENLR